MRVDVIAGARPNFMKVAALFAVADARPELELRLVHTGQHYDAGMSDVFFRDLGLPEPVRHLGVGSGTHAVQTGAVMAGYEAWVAETRPDLCLVVGDVNSTIACAPVAAKGGAGVAHVEAGLRSFDRTMPEEINRVLTDAISDLMFVSEPSGVENLRREGRPAEAVHLVGNVMIDTLARMRDRFEGLAQFGRYGLEDGGYAFLTLHRPSNVDHPEVLSRICGELIWLAERCPVAFPVHPRTAGRLKEFGLLDALEAHPGLHMVEPVGYLEALSLIAHARMVVTDSGGIQEETTFLGVPCLTLRENTERPVTVTHGTNTLIGRDWALFRDCVERIGAGTYRAGQGAIPLWDGHAGARILDLIAGAPNGGGPA